MSATRVLTNGVVVTGGLEPQIIPDGAVAWQDGRIVAAGTASEVATAYRYAEYLDAGGGMIVPGLVNLHHHFYSALARGIDPGMPMRNFTEVLDRLWWRLDRALDEETVRISAELSVADSIRHGCTTVFDHHASPSFIEGSLDTIAAVVEDAGLSALLCYEVTDRNGPAGAAAGIEENIRFIDARRDDPRVRGVFGLHANFTLRNETLAEVANRRPAGIGCHIHLAEDPVDVQETQRAFGVGPVERLRQYDLLNEDCLLAHCIHLQPGDYAVLAEHGAILIHNPESNANNGVGRLDVAEVAGLGCHVGLGTDGMSSSMLRSLRFAFLTHRGARRDPGAGFEALPGLLEANCETARRFFDEPLLGQLTPGAPADLIAIDAPPPTPLDSDNLFGHLVYGVSEYPVRHTVARGRVLLKDFVHTTLDPGAIAARARELAPDLWKRFGEQPAETSFLGKERDGRK